MPDPRRVEARLLVAINRLHRRAPSLTRLERSKLISLPANLKTLQAVLRERQAVAGAAPGQPHNDRAPEDCFLGGACDTGETGGHLHGEI